MIFSGIEIVPALLLRQIDITRILLILAHRTSHQGRTEHPLILDIQNLLIAIEIHHQSAHHGVILEMHHTRHTVEVRHQAIAELVVGYDGLVGRMIGWSDVPNLTQWPLTVGTIERNETAELVPASLQLSPFLEIGILGTILVELLLGSHIAILHTETTLVHSPERKTSHGIVQSGSHLRTHILPAGSDIARPGSGAVALFACKTGTGQEEDTLVRVHATLTIVDGVGIHDAVGIEILGRCT